MTAPIRLAYLLNNLGRTCLALPKSARHVMAMPLSIERIPLGLGVELRMAQDSPDKEGRFRLPDI